MAHIEKLASGEIVLRDDWFIEDVLSLDDSLTKEQCIEVLELCVNSFDANIGINWEVIDCAIDSIKRS